MSIPKWTPNTSYTVGTVVTHEHVTYRCVQSHVASDGRTAEHITVTPAVIRVAKGRSVQLQGVVYDTSGVVMDYVPVTWQITVGGTYADVSPDGIVRGLATSTSNTVTLVATAGAVTQSYPVTVLTSTVVSVSIRDNTLTPIPNQTLSRNVNQSVPLVAYMTYEDGTDGSSTTGKPVTWRSTAPEVVSVDDLGILVFLTGGTASIYAASEGLNSLPLRCTSVAPIVVGRIELEPGDCTVPVGGVVQITTTVYDLFDNVITGLPITYTSEKPSVVAVNSTGRVVGMSLGSSVITVACGTRTAVFTTTVEGSALVPGIITITPAQTRVPRLRTAQFTAVVTDGNGIPIPSAAVTWSVSPSNAGLVTQTGLFTAALDAGTCYVVASIGSVTQQAFVELAPAPIASIVAHPSGNLDGYSADYIIDNSAADPEDTVYYYDFVAVALDAEGQDLRIPANQFQWSVVSTFDGFASIDSNGSLSFHRTAFKTSKAYVVRATYAGYSSDAQVRPFFTLTGFYG